MKSKFLRIAVVLLLSGMVFADAQRIIPDSAVLFRNDQEFSSVAALFRDEKAWRILRTLSIKYALWKITTEEVMEGDAGDGQVNQSTGTVFLHSFDFASFRRLSKKTYRLTFRSRKIDTGKYEVTLHAAGFVPLKELPVDTVLMRGGSKIRVLRALLQSEVVVQTLVPELQGGDLASVSVVNMNVWHEIRERRTYRVRLGIKNEITKGMSYLEYEIVYDTYNNIIRDVKQTKIED